MHSFALKYGMSSNPVFFTRRWCYSLRMARASTTLQSCEATSIVGENIGNTRRRNALIRCAGRCACMGTEKRGK